MKKLYLVLSLCCFSVLTFGQIVNIPDARFKYRLVHANCAKMIDATIYSDVDTNNDGEIQLSEAQNVAELNAASNDGDASDDILSLEGIDAFSNLKKLYFRGNNIPTVDLRMLSALEELSCYGNNINTLNITGLENLRSVLCEFNSLSSLDLTGLSSLTGLACGINPLTTLDITDTPMLISLGCEGNNITTLIHGNMPTLRFLTFSGSQLTTLDTQQFPNLEYLYCNNTPINSINLNGLLNLSEIYIYNTLITTLDCSQTAVEILYCTDNPNLTSINIRNNIISSNIDCEECLVTLDFSSLPSLATICIDEGEQDSVIYYVEPTQIFGGPNCDVLMGVISNTIEDAIVLYPNPAKNSININVASGVNMQSISIYNPLGQLVKTLTANALSSSLTIDVSALNTGTYFMEIASNNGKTTNKFIKL